VNAGLPILRLGDILLGGLLSDLDDKTALAFTDELTTRIANEGIRGVIIDISRLEIVDSFVARVLMQLAGTGRLLGALTRRPGGTDERTYLTSVAVRGISAVGEPDLRAAFAHRAGGQDEEHRLPYRRD